MTSQNEADELSRLRETVTKTKADLATLEAKLNEVEDARLRALHEDFRLPNTEALIARLRRVTGDAKESSPALTAAVKAAIRADIAAGMPDEEIIKKYRISRRVLGGLRSRLPKAPSQTPATHTRAANAT